MTTIQPWSRRLCKQRWSRNLASSAAFGGLAAGWRDDLQPLASLDMAPSFSRSRSLWSSVCSSSAWTTSFFRLLQDSWW
jgi:hypothetical protein